MNRNLLIPRRRKAIGRCELCGVIDHHLVGGECPLCRDGKLGLTPTTAPRESSRMMPQGSLSSRSGSHLLLAAIYTRIHGRERRSELHGNVVVVRDSANNKTIRLLPVRSPAEGREA